MSVARTKLAELNFDARGRASTGPSLRWPRLPSSLRLRFSLLNALLLAGVIVVASGIQLWTFERQSTEQEERRALEMAKTLGDFAATYLFDLRITELNLVLANVRSATEVLDAFVVAADGTVLADGTPDNERALELVHDAQVAAALATRGPVIGRGDGTIEVASPIYFTTEEAGAVRLTLSTAAAGERLRRARAVVLTIAGIGLVVGVALTFGVVRRMTRALTALMESTRAVAGGDFGHKVRVEGEGELGELAHAFNVMVEAVREKSAHVERLAYSDGLTGLPNRTRFNAALADALAEADGSRPVGVMLLDLDRFKQVNDTMGHAAGDRLLTLVAGRLIGQAEACLGSAWRDACIIARLGGDEFVCLLKGAPAVGKAQALAERFVAVLNEPFELSEGPASIGTSIGLAFYPSDATDQAGLLMAADLAMYDAKAHGRNCCRPFKGDRRSGPRR